MTTTAPMAPAAVQRSRRGAPGAAGPLGLLGVVLVWWLLAETVFADAGSVPTPWAVVSQVVDDGWSFYGPNVGVTFRSSALGFVWGNVLALAVAFVVLLFPRLEAVAVQLAVISYCIPLVAIGPIILIVFGGTTPSVFLAAISVFFTTLIGALLGLRSADPVSLDLVAAYGGGRLQQLRRVQLISAVPALLAALKIAAPAAVLGAILGEYLGGVDTGIGVALTIAQQQLAVPRVWGLALAAGLLAGIGYVAIGLLGRLVAPWSAGLETGTR